jgi:hypothetical protein
MEASMRTIILAFTLSLCAIAQAQTARITTNEAKDHIGQVETVCGKVASAHYADRSKGQPTFLNLDEPYPHEIFTVVIWGNDRSKFGAPESTYRDARICVTGKIASYKGKPEIGATEPTQIEVESK